ncbi:alginate lyase family protein [Granulicella mallensis]|uniref:Alginate lyase domain-containing protein n=1 Tax=Granulicella mallensis TaxID=940614 RepID=A0A7W7ZMM8_9BACT|nr:alginate lyase family protein [Granulicella mallensis]MBB5062397.1 hypothetical protein [Granulicella mallensis]
MRRREFLGYTAAALAAGVEFGRSTAAVAETQSGRNEGALSKGRFVHPGILQTHAELEFMKSMVLARKEPWFGKWTEMLALPLSSLSFVPSPVTHIFRGANGLQKNGDDELHASVDAANSHVLQWFVTGDRAHAEKAAEILDAWSRTLWNFGGNDGKLIAGWTGAALCNSAEILRATYPEWGAEREERFKRMMTEVYLPLDVDFFPEANGNWDAAIMQTLAAIAVFTEDHALFEKVVTHYKFGQKNSGITKYVFPTGQCEESVRDMGHTQLGLGYFALTALVCWHQGIDLFGLADNRLALGFEYTSKYMLGEAVPYFGDIATKSRGSFSDFYEVAYQHYRYVKGLDMPYTEQAVLKAREHAKTTLTQYRGAEPSAAPAKAAAPQIPAAALPGASLDAIQAPADAKRIAPGDSIQAALDELHQAGGGSLFLAAGYYELTQPLRIPSGVTMSGAGRSTIVSLEPILSGPCLVAAELDLHDVVLREFIVEGGTQPLPQPDPNEDRRVHATYRAASRGGVHLIADRQGQMQRIRLERLTVRNCTLSAVDLQGVAEVSIAQCDLCDSGGRVAPGPGNHNPLRLTHCQRVLVRGSRLDGSLAGAGLRAISVDTIKVERCEAARNWKSGLSFFNCEHVTVSESLLEGNDENGIDLIRDQRQMKIDAGEGNILRLNGAEAASREDYAGR